MIDLNSDTVEKLRDRYRHIHPLVFHRSCERAKSEVDLFDILENIPKNRPIFWSEDDHAWVHTEDLLLAKNFKLD